MPETAESQQQIMELSNNNDQPSDPASDSRLDIEKNEDYLLVSKTLDILKQQLVKATSDVGSLNNLKTQALGDPFAFLVGLKKKSSNKVPKLQKVVSVPHIDWTKYRYLPESRLAQQHNTLHELTQQFINQTKKPTFRNILDTAMAPEYTMTQSSAPTTPTTANILQHELFKATQALHQLPSRQNSISDDSDNEDDTMSVSSKTTPKPAQPVSSAYRHPRVSGKGKGKRRTSAIQSSINLPASSPESMESPMIRSRVQSNEPRTPDEYSPMDMDDPSRAATFKQPWSDEEQKRLQELLVVYPDEPIQAQRFNKISKALGTRTPRQVASRVQKYFIKLAKLGLPVPGRVTIPPSCMPKLHGERTKPSKPKKKSSMVQEGRISKPARTSFASSSGYNSAVSGGITTSRISGAAYAQSQGPPTVLMSDDEEDVSMKEMMRITNGSLVESTDLVIHEGFACDGCGTEPIIGVLYKCTVCDPSEEVDLCGTCMEKGTFTNDHHTLTHTFEAVRTANPFPYYADNDYKSPEHLGEYGYLGF